MSGLPLETYRDLLVRLHPLHRTLVSDDMDRAVGMVVDFARAKLGLSPELIRVDEFPSGTEVSTWIVPKKYTLKDYSLFERLDGAERAIITRDLPVLSVAEYSRAVEDLFSWEEIEPHLFYSSTQPDAIPFVFRFFYRDDFGFCLPKNLFDSLSRRATFRARIDAEKTDGTLKCLEMTVPGTSEDSILLMSNLCHPCQVNDSITGVINNLMLIEFFMEHRPRHTLRFGFWPETVGAHAYFSRLDRGKAAIRWAIFTEMLGTPGKHALQFSRQANTLLDRAAVHVFQELDLPYWSGRFLTVLRNDERVSNGCNLDIPSISLSRTPYPEYHTSNDNPSIIDMNRLKESSDVTRLIVDILDSDRKLKPTFIGQPFLTRYGLFHDHTEGPEAQRLNRIQEDVYSYSDGETSLFEIADRFRYDWHTVKEQADRLMKAKLLV